MAKGKLKCPGWHGKWECQNDVKDCGILDNSGPEQTESENGENWNSNQNLISRKCEHQIGH